ncbi:Lysine/ornithine decarboxylase [Rubripirellula lacrimiformis]|uniref:ornithine decarboxylase n=2 Tax=Rubripirellula lacrimiformis TaxID=1930273 RepID=A0A517NHX2_9BACT|nr:Lysine/ornithine decarboxylase [Rubripirellula lacrimiformis]
MQTDILTPQLLRSAQSVLSFDQARELGERHGTPLLVVSKSKLVQTYRTMRDHLPGVELFYAAKANPNPFVLQTLYEEGCSVDVCSHGELIAAKQAGFDPAGMLHTHPCKTRQNLLDCYNEGVRLFVFDNEPELDKIKTHTPDVQLLLRLAMSADSSLINLSAKFGAHPREVVGLLVAARSRGLNVKGFSFHVGSQCLNPGDYRRVLERVRQCWDEAAEMGFELEVLDIGGGFPAPYRDSEMMTLATYCDSVSASLSEVFGDLPIRLIAEPGRGLVAECVTLVTQVLGKNLRSGLNWYIIDDGIYGSFSGKIFDHVDYNVIAENPFGRPLHPCVLAGPTCDSSDVVARDQMLPEMNVGDLLLVPTMGAYAGASACPFNGLPVAGSAMIA